MTPLHYTDVTLSLIIEEKRNKLHRLYDRIEKKRMESKLAESKKMEAAMGHHVDSQGKPVTSPKLSDYEKNKLNNGKSHIEITCSSIGSTSRSLPPSATLRGTN